MIFAATAFIATAVFGSHECKDEGIPDYFASFFPSCDSICGDPMLMVAASMFCAKTCGICQPEEPEDVFEKSYEDCSRQEIAVVIEEEIRNIIDEHYNFDAVQPCLRMQTHLGDILDSNDALVGTPNVLLICGCLEHFDESFAQEHLNCMIAEEHVYDLSMTCQEIGGYSSGVCDGNAIAQAIADSEEIDPDLKAECAGIATALSTYGSADFDPSSLCNCVYYLDPVFAGRNLNCMTGGQHAMSLYEDICPAYVKPCNTDSMKSAMATEIQAMDKVDQLSGVCDEMAMHMEEIVDPVTNSVKAGAFANFPMICQCLGQFHRQFIDDHLRCGLGGHDSFTVWSQCTEHTPKCEDITNCHLCNAKLRCAMDVNGNCRNTCPNDGTCLKDPQVDVTCEDLENEGLTGFTA